MAPRMRIPITMTILPFSREAAGKINRWGFALLAAGILAAGRPANAQFPTGFPSRVPGLPTKPQTKQWKPVVPPEYRPPAGMCRVWIEGVQPSRQPAPTDCSTAVKNKPVNGTVIFGDDVPKRGNDKPKKDKKKDSDTSSDS